MYSLAVIAKLDPKENGKISIVAFIYIVVFNILGSSVGVACSSAIGPGNFAEKDAASEPPAPDTKSADTSDVFADLL